jgi:hypothetical protein
MTLTHHGKKLILTHERSDIQKLYCNLYALGVIGFVLITAVYAGRALILHTSAATTSVMVFLAVAAFGSFNVWEALCEADSTTEFDLAAKTVTQTETGWINRTHGPVPFDEVSSLVCQDGSVGRQRAAIARLTLRDGSRWQLGHDRLWVRPMSTSDVPALLGKIRGATGFAGADAA